MLKLLTHRQKKMIWILRRKEAELRVISSHLSRLSFDIFGELQTKPVTEMTETLIRNAINKVNRLSIKKVSASILQ